MRCSGAPAENRNDYGGGARTNVELPQAGYLASPVFGGSTITHAACIQLIPRRDTHALIARHDLGHRQYQGHLQDPEQETLPTLPATDKL